MSESHQRVYEFRCPVHGFVTLNDWEREIISQPAFQRLGSSGIFVARNHVTHAHVAGEGAACSDQT